MTIKTLPAAGAGTLPDRSGPGANASRRAEAALHVAGTRSNGVGASATGSPFVGTGTRPRLRVRWFERWDAELDRALEALPEMELLPHEVYRPLMQGREASPRRAALVTERDRPVVLAILKRDGPLRWVPATQWLVPRCVFPCQPGYLMPALEAMGVDIWVGCWRWGADPPPSRYLRKLERTPTYSISLTDHYEAYWRGSSHFNRVKEARNRCRDFSWSPNVPGACAWVIRSCGEKFHMDADEVRDRVLVCEFLERTGKNRTIVLLDEGEWIAGCSVCIDRDELVAHTIYRRPEYDKHGVGVRVIDTLFKWGADSGYRRLDLGGGYSFKARWAPEGGEHVTFNLCPDGLFLAKELGRVLRDALRRVPGLKPTAEGSSAGPTPD